MPPEDYLDELATLSCRNLKLRQVVRSQTGVIAGLYAELDRLRAELAKVKREKRDLRQRLGSYSAKYGERETVYEATEL